MMRDDQPPMEPILEWLTAMTEAHVVTKNRLEARLLASCAQNVWRDFSKRRRAVVHLRLIEGQR